MRCAVCDIGRAGRYRSVGGVQYFRCVGCGSLFADPAFLAADTRVYADDYWDSELAAARERCFGPAVLRVAETIAYCRIPIRAFLDIGAGTGWLLDALRTLLPEVIDLFHAVERFPPPLPHRTGNANYLIGTVADTRQTFDAGVCIEVIEHLAPHIFRHLAMELAAVSRPGSLYLFNSGQPEFVECEDPAYLDPHGRGHIVSYSLAGAASILEPAGFNVIALPGRAWAFLAEFGPHQPVNAEALLARLWHPVPENVSMLRAAHFGELIRCAGIEAARAYLSGR
jgi:hypothetical protein